MNLPGLLLGVGGSFLFLCLVFYPLERAFPAKRGQRFLRPEWWIDLCFFLGQYLLWSGLVLWLLSRFGDGLDGIVPAGFRAAVAGQPWWLQAVEVILLSDFFVYWGHRLQHRVPFLWRFHSVHHSAEHLDWLAAHREHPLDTVYTMGLINLPAPPVRFSAEDADRPDRLPRDLGDLHSLERPAADRASALVHRGAGAASLAS